MYINKDRNRDNNDVHIYHMISICIFHVIVLSFRIGSAMVFFMFSKQRHKPPIGGWLIPSVYGDLGNGLVLFYLHY